MSAFLFYCLLLHHSFPTNPNSVTNCFKLILSLLQLYNYVAPAFAILIFEQEPFYCGSMTIIVNDTRGTLWDTSIAVGTTNIPLVDHVVPVKMYGSTMTQRRNNQDRDDDGKYSSERAAREWSTVVDISITSFSFKLVSLSSPRSPLFKTPKQVIF